MSEQRQVIAPSVIAIDIGGSTTKLARVNSQGDVAYWKHLLTEGPTSSAFYSRLLEMIRQIEHQAEHPPLGISLAIAGFVDKEGTLTYNPNLPWLEHAPLAASLREELHMAVHVETDANAACAAEYVFGEGRESTRFLCLTGGTGLAVGMISDGRLLRVAHGCMGDAGHIILSPDGPACTCGGRGCAEAFLSTVVLGQRYGQLVGQAATFRMLVEDAHRREPAALSLLTEAGRWLGLAAASLSNIFFPDRVAVAGGLSRAGDAFFAAAESSFRSHGGHFPLSRATLVRASTGEHATLLGAAACFFYPELSRIT